MIRKIAIVLALGLSLGGCATFQAEIAKFQAVYTEVTTATVPASVAQAAVSSWEVIEASATQYFIYCKQNPATSVCYPGTVTQPGPLRLAIKYDRQGRNARDQIKAAGKSGALISSTIYNVLVNTVAAISATPVATFGATK